MAEETKQPVPVVAPEASTTAKEKAVAEKAAAEPTPAVVEKPAEKEIPTPEPVPEPEPEVTEKPVAAEEVVVEAEKEKAEENKIAESASFKEESNVVADLPNPQQKALDELKKLVEEALDKHEFTAPPPPPAKEDKKAEPETAAAPAEAESKPEEKKESEAVPESKQEEKKEPEAPADVPPPAKEEPSKPEAEKVVETKAEEITTPPPPAAEEKPDDTKVEEKTIISPPESAASSESVVVAEKVEQKVEAAVEEDGTKTVEEIKTIVEVTTSASPPPPAATEEKPKEGTTEAPETKAPPPTPEEVSIWGIKLLEDERSDTILLKFLRARDFKVKEAFAMLKSVVAWRKQFGIDDLLEDENICEGLDKVVYLHGVDKEGHPVIYNAFGEFQNKELYQNTFADAEKRTKFLKGMIIFLEKTIRNLDFTPDGICTLFQVIDLKNTPGLFFFKKDLRQAINQALQLFQDNYPEFVAKQVYINVPWWYPAYYRMFSAIFTPRTKSKFVFAGPSRSAETLFKYIAPEKVPVQYGGLSRDGNQEFTTDDAATEETIKSSSKHTVEFEVPEICTLVWELRVVGWDVSYGAEFVPSAEGGYTVIVQKSRKIGPTDEPIISTSYKIGEPGKVVLTFDNQTSKRKKLVYRSKTKPSD